MRFKLLFLAVAAMLLIPQAASAQPFDPYGRRYDDGYRGPPPPRDYRYEERRYEERRDERREYYREQRPQRARGVFCAQEGGFCRFQGPAVVRYGAGGRFTSRRAFDGIPCTNSVFISGGADGAPPQPASAWSCPQETWSNSPRYAVVTQSTAPTG